MTRWVLGEHSSDGMRWGGVSVETGWRVKDTESMADSEAPAVVQPNLFARRWSCGSVMALDWGEPQQLEALSALVHQSRRNPLEE